MHLKENMHFPCQDAVMEVTEHGKFAGSLKGAQQEVSLKHLLSRGPQLKG